jgi:hypothetical protein
MKINNKISLYSLYLQTMKRQYIYSWTEDSEVVLVSERNDAGLKKLSSFVWTDKWLICLPKCHVFFKVCTQLWPVLVMKNAVFWDVAPYTSCVNRCFKGMHGLHLQGRKNPRARIQLEQVAAATVHTRSTRRHIPEDGILHSHRRENLKSYLVFFILHI